jgi:hypothetical protein
MLPKSFYDSAFADLKIDILSQINEIREASKANPKERSKLMLFYNFTNIHNFSNYSKEDFIFDWAIDFFNTMNVKQISLSIMNNTCSIESFLKAYRSLHEFDFEYEGLGLYIYRNARYHSLHSSITLICNNKDFVHPSDLYYTRMNNEERVSFINKKEDELREIRFKMK